MEGPGIRMEAVNTKSGAVCGRQKKDGRAGSSLGNRQPRRLFES